MGVLTDFLNLFKKEPIIDKDDTFNITTMLNENWDKIDAFAESLNQKTDDHIEDAAEHVQSLPVNAFSFAETGLSYPLGISLFQFNASGVGFPTAGGQVLTIKTNDDRISQFITETSITSPKQWYREFRVSSGAWSNLLLNITETSGDARYLKKIGDAMTGALILPKLNLLDVSAGRCSEIAIVQGMNLAGSLTEIEISMANITSTGSLEIELASIFFNGEATGKIVKNIDFRRTINQVATNVDSKYTYIGKETGQKFMISDLYIKNNRPTFKIVQRADGRNPAILRLKFLGQGDLLTDVLVSDVVSSVETFVYPSMTPTETVVTSGFAVEWSGTVSMYKSRENLCVTQVQLNKSADISVGAGTLYTLPASPINYRPKRNLIETVTLYDAGGNIITGARAWVNILTDGSVILRSAGTITGARSFNCIVPYYV